MVIQAHIAPLSSAKLISQVPAVPETDPVLFHLLEFVLNAGETVCLSAGV